MAYFPGLTESTGRFRSTPRQSKRCVSRSYLVSGTIAPSSLLPSPLRKRRTDALHVVDAARALRLLLHRGIPCRDDIPCGGSEPLVVGEALQVELGGVLVGRLPFRAVHLEQCQMLGVVDDAIQCFLSELDQRAVILRDHTLTDDIHSHRVHLIRDRI